jgi:hypothetical protein
VGSSGFLFHGHLSHFGKCDFFELFSVPVGMGFAVVLTLLGVFHFFIFFFFWSQAIILETGAAEQHGKGNCDQEDTVGERGCGDKAEVVFLAFFKLFLDSAFEALFWCD